MAESPITLEILRSAGKELKKIQRETLALEQELDSAYRTREAAEATEVQENPFASPTVSALADTIQWAGSADGVEVAENRPPPVYHREEVKQRLPSRVTVFPPVMEFVPEVIQAKFYRESTNEMSRDDPVVTRDCTGNHRHRYSDKMVK